MDFLLSLQSTSNHLSKNEVGEKAYSLLKLNEVHLNVPIGFVLNVASQEYFKDNKEKLKHYLESQLPTIASEFVMIRSSAVGEDGKDYSFAGQLDSFKVKNNLQEITEGVFNCWKSLTNKRAQIYQNIQKQTITQMGVILQQRVEPEYSGVYFTSAPDHADLPLVEYVQGDCEKLVQGEVIPETHYLPSSHSFPFCIKTLQQLGDKIQNFFNEAQDIEWLYANQKFYFVQTRPVTRAQKRFYWSSTNVNENYPDKLSPLLYSIARRSYYHYFKNLTKKLSLLKPGEGESAFYNIIGTWGERMYYNMSQIHFIIALTPFRNLLAHSFNHFVGYQKEKKVRSLSYSRAEKVLFLGKLFFHFVFLPRYVRQIERRVDQFADQEIVEKKLSILYHEFLDIRFNFWVRASFADFFAMLFHGALGKFLTKIKIKNSQGRHNTLIQSIPNLVSNKPIFEMWKLRQEIVHSKKETLFKENSAKDIWQKIQGEPELALLKKNIEAYLKEWGFRCSGELTFLSKNYIEDPIRFIETLQVYVHSEEQDPTILFHLKHQEQQHCLKQTRKEIYHNHFFFKSLLYSFLLKILVKGASYSIACRERVRLKQAKMYFKFKEVCFSFGKLLQQKGIFLQAFDIFSLEYDEISRLFNSEEVFPEYLKELILLRNRKKENATEYCENFYNFEFDYTNYVLDQDEVQIKESRLKGLPACGGTVQGRAVVLQSIHEITQLQKGDILVTKQTDPGWICAFPIISGLAVERGGMLSHGAIVAREFGIPAVVGLKGITTHVKTGDTLFLDGNQGTVECLKFSN